MTKFCCCCCCSLRCLSIFIVLISIVVYLAIWNVIKTPPPVDFQELQRSGAKYFILNDGRVLEYFEAGAPRANATETWLYLHGMLTTGYSICKLLNKTLQENNVALVCPTSPGNGFSDWTDAPTIEYTYDIAQLSDFLHVAKWDLVMGLSAGGLHAAVIATGMPSRVGDVLFVAGTPPDVSWYNYSLALDWTVRAMAETYINELLMIPILEYNCTSYYITVQPEEEVLMLADKLPLICEDALRTVARTDRGYASMPKRWFRKTPVDFTKLEDGTQRKVIIIYGEHDSLITPSTGRNYHLNIPGSRLFRAKGCGHSVTCLSVEQYLGFFLPEVPGAPEFIIPQMLVEETGHF